jgi:hypothetical protein
MARGILKILVDGSDRQQVRLVLSSGAEHHFINQNLSERLIPEIQKFLRKQKLSLKNIAKIEVRTSEAFSKARTIVATANGLIFSLGLEQKLIKPVYNREPNITWSKKFL